MGATAVQNDRSVRSPATRLMRALRLTGTAGGSRSFIGKERKAPKIPKTLRAERAGHQGPVLNSGNDYSLRKQQERLAQGRSCASVSPGHEGGRYAPVEP